MKKREWLVFFAAFVLIGLVVPACLYGQAQNEPLELRLEFPELPLEPLEQGQAYLVNTTGHTLFFRAHSAHHAHWRGSVVVRASPWSTGPRWGVESNMLEFPGVELMPGESLLITSSAFLRSHRNANPYSFLTGTVYISSGNRLQPLPVSVGIMAFMDSGDDTEFPVPAADSLSALQWFTDVGQITTQTWETPAHTVTVVMQFGYDEDDAVTFGELFSRQHELRDFTRRHFAGRSAEELRPENEASLRREIMETLNVRYLNNARIRDIRFERLDVE